MPPQQGDALPDLGNRILDFSTHQVLAGLRIVFVQGLHVASAAARRNLAPIDGGPSGMRGARAHPVTAGRTFASMSSMVRATFAKGSPPMSIWAR